MSTYRVLDAGFVVRITCKRDGVATDVSGYDNHYILLKNGQTGAVLTKTASFEIDGTDGKIKATIGAAEISGPGQWKVAPLVTGPSPARFEGKANTLEVQPNL